jgi:hypothetical protein
VMASPVHLTNSSIRHVGISVRKEIKDTSFKQPPMCITSILNLMKIRPDILEFSENGW